MIIAGGEKLPIPYIERLQRTFPSAWLADAYGLTETVSGDTFLDREQHAIEARQRRTGVPVPGARHLGRARAASVPAGERGEVVLRGPKVFKGYWRDPDGDRSRVPPAAGSTPATSASMDDDGYVYIVDRLKDMIVSGGENIASSEVERVLYEHDAVLEVAVVGRPDERWGEVPVAVRRAAGRRRRRPPTS